ncbi:MAG: heme-binding protein [Synechococcus sp. MED-G71]|jgi:glc operon protein GlcG|nr:MAG: heme-binding protein [Synechococcus sp. MED-G71]|tara:strand:- start:602 stop:1042 length:441 start_codon:yes stop_codon:yes gene_type:complete
MRSILCLESADSDVIMAAADAAAQRNQARVSIALVGMDGYLLRFKRLHQAAPASCEIAIAKARMAALSGKATADLEASINTNRPALLQLSMALNQPAVSMGGGLPLMAGDQCLGAVGVSGMTPAEDSAIASAGVQALRELLAVTTD